MKNRDGALRPSSTKLASCSETSVKCLMTRSITIRLDGAARLPGICSGWCTSALILICSAGSSSALAHRSSLSLLCLDKSPKLTREPATQEIGSYAGLCHANASGTECLFPRSDRMRARAQRSTVPTSAARYRCLSLHPRVGNL
jgi:hypothetical protein